MFQLTAANFESFVCQNADRLSMIHFRADWNPLDPQMREVTADVEAAVGNQLALAEVDCDLPENLELQEHLGLSHIPALFFIFRNRVVDYKVGYSKVRLVSHVQQLMQMFRPYAPDMPQPLHPGPFPSGIVLPPKEDSSEMGHESASRSLGGTGHPRNSDTPFPQGHPLHRHPVIPNHALGGPGGIRSQAPDFPSPFPGPRPGFNQPLPPKFGLIPHRLVVEQPKKSWWARLLS